MQAKARAPVVVLVDAIRPPHLAVGDHGKTAACRVVPLASSMAGERRLRAQSEEEDAFALTIRLVPASLTGIGIGYDADLLTEADPFGMSTSRQAGIDFGAADRRESLPADEATPGET